MCPVSFRAPGDRGVDLPATLFEGVRAILPTAAHINLFASGEPTLAPRLASMIDAVRTERAPGAKAWLSTNGKRLSRELVDRLIAAGCGLQFSVDGGTQQVFEAIRRGIRWQELLASLELVRERRAAGSRLPLAFSTTLSKQNLHDLSNIFALAARYGVEHVMFYDEDPETPERAALVLDASDRPLFEAQLPFIESTGVSFANGLSFRGAAVERVSVESSARGGVHCSAPWNVFMLRADGSVRTCCTLRDSMGDLEGRSFDEVWNGEAYTRLRRAFVEQRGIPSTCYRCTDPLRTWGDAGSTG
jgi:MoaA/NifB/PqqE/SkfB family radical SAM enzyme